MRIIISIATFNRPAGLAYVLDGIGRQKITEQHDVTVVVTDNSPDGNAGDFIESKKSTFCWELVYLHETTTGISYARNAGLNYGLTNDFDYLVFIDDDECPSEEWLYELVKVCEETDSPAAVGAVKPRFDERPPWWIIKAGYFETADQLDRTAVPNGYTTNAIVRISVIRELNLLFDPRFALTGGEDTLLFKEIQKGKGDILYARQAVTYETIVPARASLKALMKYWFRTGNTKGILRISADGNKRHQKTKILMSSLARIVTGIVMGLITLPALLFRQVYFFRFVRILCRGVGYFMSIFGVEYQEYKNHSR